MSFEESAPDGELSMGEVCEDLHRHGTRCYVGPDGKIWHLKYLGEVRLDAPPAGQL